MVLEAALVALLVGVAALPLALLARRALARSAGIGLVVVLSAGAYALAVGLRPVVQAESAVTERPIQETDAGPHDGYVGSETCRACHPDQHDSWSDSYHSRMTQRPSAAAVLAPFDGGAVDVGGRRYRMSSEGGRFVVDDGSTRRQVALLTGSHHMQIYWASTGQGRELDMLPLVWLTAEQRWIPREAAFLQPPAAHDPEGELGRWNRECIRCHATHGQPREKTMDSRVAEFAITCEACHGPGQAHVAANQFPPRRYALHLGEDADPTVVHPERLELRAGSQVCGQCHAILRPMGSPAQIRRFDQQGSPFRPGAGELEDDHVLLRVASYSGQPDSEGMRLLKASGEFRPRSQFWSDGMVRVSGREYNGLIESPCFRAGELSCLSCHQMHRAEDDAREQDAWTDDQLAEDMGGNAACTQCHEQLADEVALVAHSHHPARSSGSDCYNCHMPHTTYGLLKAIRSHTIDSPSVATDLATGRLNACNLCHVDKSLAWTAEQLAGWDISADRHAVELDETAASVPAAIERLLRGDAGQRAISAWALGWEPARQVSGEHWRERYLAELLDDPYDAVRFIAGRSLSRQAGFSELAYDFLAPPEERQQRRAAALALWEHRRRQAQADLAAGGTGASSASVPGAGVASIAAVALPPVLTDEQVAALLAQRNDRPVKLAE